MPTVLGLTSIRAMSCYVRAVMTSRLCATSGITALIVSLTLASGAGVAAAAEHGAASTGPGYELVAGDGSTYAFNAPTLMNLPGNPTLGPPLCAVPSTSWSCARVGIGATGGVPGPGYWVGEAGQSTGGNGQILYGGDVYGYGNTNTCSGNSSVVTTNPVVGMSSAQGGALLVGADGGVFAFCSAQFYGSMGGQPLNEPIVGIAATPDGMGYWLVASDGGIFSFGDAKFYGSMGAKPLNRPIVGMAATPDGKGYWLVASDGGIFAFGDATFAGSEGGSPIVSPMVAIAANPDGTGYWTVASDGGVFAFGDAPFLGSAAGHTSGSPIVGIAATG